MLDKQSSYFAYTSKKYNKVSMFLIKEFLPYGTKSLSAKKG